MSSYSISIYTLEVLKHNLYLQIIPILRNKQCLKTFSFYATVVTNASLRPWTTKNTVIGTRHCRLLHRIIIATAIAKNIATIIRLFSTAKTVVALVFILFVFVKQYFQQRQQCRAQLLPLCGTVTSLKNNWEHYRQSSC